MSLFKKIAKANKENQKHFKLNDVTFTVTSNANSGFSLDDICSVEDFSDFYLHTYYVIAKLGLQRIAKEEHLFKGEEWINPHCKEYLVNKLKEFLIRHIK